MSTKKTTYCDICQKTFEKWKWFEGPVTEDENRIKFSPYSQLVVTKNRPYCGIDGAGILDICIECKNDIILRWAEEIKKETTK